MPSVKCAEREGVRLCYDERDGGAPPLVFVHGWCCDHRHFGPQLEHFAGRHRVVALDQRGFGCSDKPEQAYTIDGFADDLQWLCQRLEIERPVLVGHSLGGAVILAAAARHPQLPRALALCDPAIFLPQAADAAQRKLLEGLATDGFRQAATRFIDRFLFIESDDPARKTRIIEQMLATPRHVMRSAFENLRCFDETAAAQACRIPVLHIDADPAFGGAERLREHCSQLVSERTPGVGHFHQLEAPERVNEILDRFITNLPPDSP
jgi:pimeloyl-ACP methyl ester carboxylesterase